MFCKNCGNEFNKGIFCPRCGTKNMPTIIEEVEKEKTNSQKQDSIEPRDTIDDVQESVLENENVGESDTPESFNSENNTNIVDTNANTDHQSTNLLILSIVGAILTLITVGIVVEIVVLFKASKALRINENDKKAKTSRTIAIVTLVIAAVLLIINQFI